MLTKQQKQSVIESAVASLKESQAVVFVDFAGVGVNDLNAFRRALRSAGARLEVIKKRLLKIAFEQAGESYDPTQFEAQAGAIFSKVSLLEAAQVAVKNKLVKVLGGYEMAGRRAVSGAEVVMLGSLPPREVLLGQLVGTIAAPVRSLLYVLSERSRQTV